MKWGIVALLASGGWPLLLAWLANRRTTLRPALGWSTTAWLAWLLTWATRAWDGEPARLGAYLGLCLTGCASVAVLGARRPGLAAWNFVVLGLLAVLLLPVAEGWGQPRLDVRHLLFLGLTLAFGLTNYLPTRLAPAVLLLGSACGLELYGLGTRDTVPGWLRPTAGLCLGASPWLAWLVRRRQGRESAVDRLWLAFRDRFGVVWSQRTREQFNRAAANAGWSVSLAWDGLVRPETDGPSEEEVLATLRALLKRFEREE